MSWGYAAIIAMVFYRDQIGGLIERNPLLILAAAILLICVQIGEGVFNMWVMWKNNKGGY